MLHFSLLHFDIYRFSKKYQKFKYIIRDDHLIVATVYLIFLHVVLAIMSDPCHVRDQLSCCYSDLRKLMKVIACISVNVVTFLIALARGFALWLDW